MSFWLKRTLAHVERSTTGPSTAQPSFVMAQATIEVPSERQEHGVSSVAEVIEEDLSEVNALKEEINRLKREESRLRDENQKLAPSHDTNAVGESRSPRLPCP